VSRFYDLDHLGGFLLLVSYIKIHFTGEPGLSCPWDRDCIAILFCLLSILALKDEAFRIT